MKNVFFVLDYDKEVRYEGPKIKRFFIIIKGYLMVWGVDASKANYITVRIPVTAKYFLSKKEGYISTKIK